MDAVGVGGAVGMMTIVGDEAKKGLIFPCVSGVFLQSIPLQNLLMAMGQSLLHEIDLPTSTHSCPCDSPVMLAVFVCVRLYV